MPVLTPERAREIGRLGHKARAKNFQRHLETQMAVEVTDHVSRELLRVRVHLERVNKLMENAVDPLDIMRLSQALNKLHEDERELDGRPKAGAYRPSSPPKKAKNQGGEVE